MKQGRGAIQPVVLALLTATVILAVAAGILGYDYSLAESQVSKLKDSGQTYCSAVDSVDLKIVNTFANVTDSLQAQIQADQSVTASLNASKPTGFEAIVAVLNQQIAQDSAIITEITSYTSLSQPNYDFCYLANGY
jgi:hypothetical protein